MTAIETLFLGPALMAALYSADAVLNGSLGRTDPALTVTVGGIAAIAALSISAIWLIWRESIAERRHAAFVRSLKQD